MIRTGSAIRFDAAGSSDGWDDADTRSRIDIELSKYFRVQAIDLKAGGSFAEYFGWPFRADITVTTREDYGELNDVSSIVAHAIYEATGYMPTVSVPSAGQPSQPTPDVGGNPLSPVYDLLSGLDSTARFVLVVVALVAVAFIVGVGGKTTRLGVAL
jgi:hypothetical protein